MQQENSSLWIGYPILEDMLEVVRLRNLETLYVTLIEKPPETANYSFPSVYSTVLAVQCISPLDGCVRYCHIVLARITYLHGQAFDSDAKEKHERAHDAFALIQKFLHSQGFTLERALVAMPKNLAVLEGCAEFWRYNTKTNRYEAESSAVDQELSSS